MSSISPAADVRGPDEATSFAAAFRSHAPYVWRLLRRLGATAHDADDLCQEVFVVLHRRWGELELGRPLRPWIYGVAVRIASNHRRRRRLGELEQHHLAGTYAPQQEAMEHRQVRDLLADAIARLDEPKRAVFVLHELEELKMPEIAEAMSCPLQTAYSRLHAARGEVRAYFARIEAKGSAR